VIKDEVVFCAESNDETLVSLFVVCTWWCCEIFWCLVMTDIWLPASSDVTQLGARRSDQTPGQHEALCNNSKNFETCRRGSQRTGWRFWL